MKPLDIIIHCSDTKDSGTVSWSAIRKWHKGEIYGSPHRWSDIGYHFGIELIGDTYETLLGRMMWQRGAHCSKGGMNGRSLGICVVGQFNLQKPGVEQWNKAVLLTATLCRIFRIGHGRIFGHGEIDQRKTCPGTAFKMVDFRSDVEEYIYRHFKVKPIPI